MPTCTAGHDSATSDYCDTCGVRIGAAAAPPAPPAAAPAGGAPTPASPAAAPSSSPSSGPGEPASSPAATSPAAPGVCPGCGEAVEDRFCESCGYDVESGQPVAPAAVTLVLDADRGHWDRVVGSGEPAFPAVAPTLTFELRGEAASLGRVRSGAPVDVDLALTGAAADPAVSHHQCEFERDGSHWLVRDAESSNGTWINDAAEPLAAGEAHRLADGDRILMGAWTCLTVHVAPTS